MTATPDTSPEDDDLAGYDVNGRMCIASRESGSPDELIRFVDVRKRRSQLAAGGLPAHLRRAAA